MNILPYLQAGDSAIWTDTAATLNGVAYDSSTYGLTYSLRGQSALDLTAAAVGRGWQTNITCDQSAALIPGPYRWAAYYTATGQRITAGQGEITIALNLQTLAAGQTALTFYEQALASIEQAMAAYGSNGGAPLEWQIGTNRYRFNSLAEIQATAAYFNAAVTYEKTGNLLAQGQGNPRRIFANFNNRNPWGSNR